jgi:hypothetical protein
MIYLTQDWDEFDTWCLFRNVDAHTLSSRRLVNLTVAHLAEGRDRNALLAELEPIGDSLLRRSPISTTGKAEAPPPGWRSDEANWAGIQTFLGSMGTVKGGVSRGS